MIKLLTYMATPGPVGSVPHREMLATRSPVLCSYAWSVRVGCTNWSSKVADDGNVVEVELVVVGGASCTVTCRKPS